MQANFSYWLFFLVRTCKTVTSKSLKTRILHSQICGYYDLCQNQWNVRYMNIEDDENENEWSERGEDYLDSEYI